MGQQIEDLKRHLMQRVEQTYTPAEIRKIIRNQERQISEFEGMNTNGQYDGVLRSLRVTLGGYRAMLA